MLQSAGTRIGRLRMRSGGREALGLRLTVERQLSGLDLPAPGLPPSALVIIRRLEDPLPASFDVAAEGFRPPAEWEAALRQQVADLGRSAAWPEGCEPPQDAAAVAFSDRASLAACLVRDLARGSAGAHWWWKRVGLLLPELVRVPRSPAEAPRLFVALAPETPAIFAKLVELRAAAEVLGHFSEDQAREVVQALVHAFELPAALRQGPPDIAAGHAGRSAPQRSVGRSRRGSTTAASEILEAARRERAPWHAWMPMTESHSALGDGQHWLLGLALGLQRAPTIVRSPSFAQRARRWWQARRELVELRAAREPLAAEMQRRRRQIPDEAQHPRGAAESPRPLDPAPVGRSEAWRATPGVEPPRAAALAHAATPPSTQVAEAERDSVEPAAPAEPGAGREAALREAPDDDLAGSSWSEPDPAMRNAQATAAQLDTSPASAASPSADVAAEPPAPESLAGRAELAPGEPFRGECFETALGGVLYLVTALGALEAGKAFDPRWQPAGLLGPWGVLDLVARALLGDAFEEHADDPLWRALAELRGEVEPPAVAAVRSPRGSPLAAWDALPAYRAPRSWSMTLESGDLDFRWAASRRRLWLWSRAGYLVASVPRRGRRPGGQAAEEAAAFLERADAVLRRGRLADVPLAPTGAIARHDPTQAVGWAAAVAPALRRRLLLAVGGRTRATDPVLRLLRLRARLYLTSSHVDLVADLGQVWMPARLAGLDRDPGWLPDYGRVVLFHFE